MRNGVKTAIFFALLGVIASSNAIADPNIIEIGIVCPDTSGIGQYTLSNFNGYIAGYGREYVNGGTPAPVLPYFSTKSYDGNFPSQIAAGAYTSTSTAFDPTQAIVTCSYISSAGFDPINVNYWMTNAQGSTIVGKTSNTINLNVFVGLRKE